mmetsp:Transcript_1953/g.5108  ORF Transcript_1953/g.5108 Transcript_1953/m.5108 type:complete len:214 (-) Transcript_1953:2540-3181(-)
MGTPPAGTSGHPLLRLIGAGGRRWPAALRARAGASRWRRDTDAATPRAASTSAPWPGPPGEPGRGAESLPGACAREGGEEGAPARGHQASSSSESSAWTIGRADSGGSTSASAAARRLRRSHARDAKAMTASPGRPRSVAMSGSCPRRCNCWAAAGRAPPPYLPCSPGPASPPLGFPITSATTSLAPSRTVALLPAWLSSRARTGAFLEFLGA